MQAITTKSGVHPGGTASYAIWVWPAGGAASGVTVTISSKAASKDVTPKFTVCPTASGRTCKVGGIAKGTSDELQATAAVPSSTAAGKDISLTATAKASDADRPAGRGRRPQDHRETVVDALAVPVADAHAHLQSRLGPRCHAARGDPAHRVP